MSDDPETARQIAELALDTRPLLVLDVDDVLLEFVRPFPKFLETQGFGLQMSSFRLTGNIYERASGRFPEQPEVHELLGRFFDTQAEWQVLTQGAAEAMASFADRVEIVLLTAMPHRHRAVRRAHLDTLGFPYPLVTTEMAKGPALASLRGTSGRPVAFVDDMPHNLISARQSVPDAHLFHLMADTSIRALLPPIPAETDIIAVEDWREATPKIAAVLGV